ncbi:hypothetical protein [Nonomuraea zeae]|uniref:Uncharacterized protein n=1 Tax=Nonomuraea zeae TaxID=1642303 RepID=A0A5S4GU41_9ACTN|nr:hypothetical protein [Nonomuraea zeae]TMR36242.1 hypothetical protein ETD85_11595 [Nonomuraea zeae]
MSKPCAECGLEELDDLNCRTQGIIRQAELTQAAAETLRQFRQKYDGARSSYVKARGEAAPVVQELAKKAATLINKIRCLLEEQEIKKLDQAWKRVAQDLADCPGLTGCCVHDPCDFDLNVENVPLKVLVEREADVKRRTDAAVECFKEVVEEPVALPQRVTKLQAKIAAIESDLGGETKSKEELHRLYVRAVVAAFELRDAQIWRGFANVHAFMDCLCRGLTCALRGHRALAVLGGAIATQKCRQEAHKAYCKRLREDPVDDVLTQYAKLTRLDEDAE